MGWRRGTFETLRGLCVVALVGLGASATSTVLGTRCSLSVEAGLASASAADTGDPDDADDPEADDLSGPRFAPEAPHADKDALADAIVAANLFCPTCAPAGPGPRPPGGVAATRLPLELLVTMEASDPRLSLATIRDTEQQTLGAYGVDDVVRIGVSVYEIGRGRVVLRNGLQLETIEAGQVLPPAPAVAEAAPPPKAPDADAIEGAEQAIRCAGDRCSVDRAFVDRLLSNPASLSRQARVMPSGSGFKFYGVRPGSLPKLLGLENGDTLTSVNGTQLNSLDQALDLYAKLRRASHLSVTIERKGKTIHKDIDIE